ncbi:MAG: hypothetical protein AB1758_20010 [Candidatus Eremiobacterota bacterium]
MDDTAVIARDAEKLIDARARSEAVSRDTGASEVAPNAGQTPPPSETPPLQAASPPAVIPMDGEPTPLVGPSPGNRADVPPCGIAEDVQTTTRGWVASERAFTVMATMNPVEYSHSEIPREHLLTGIGGCLGLAGTALSGPVWAGPDGHSLLGTELEAGKVGG